MNIGNIFALIVFVLIMGYLGMLAWNLIVL